MARRYSDRRRALQMPDAEKRELVAEYLRGDSVRAVAIRHAVGQTFVWTELATAGVKCRSRGSYQRKTSADQEREIASLYQGGAAITEIGPWFGIGFSTVASILERQGVGRRGPSESHRTHSLNEGAFDHDTPEANYWTGMLITDGCVHTNQGRNVVKLSLTATDRDHVERFRAFLKTDLPVRTSWRRATAIGGNEIRPGWCVTLCVYSKRLVAVLGERGVVPRKTHVALAPGWLARDRDFWRGAVDGDGYIGEHRPKKVQAGLCSASRGFIDQFQEFVQGAGIPTVARPLLTKSHWAFTLSCANARRLLTILYRDTVVALDRKAQLARQLTHDFTFISERHARTMPV